MHIHICTYRHSYMAGINCERRTSQLFNSFNIWWQYFLIADTVQNSHITLCVYVSGAGVVVSVCVCLHDQVGRAEMYFTYLQNGSALLPHCSHSTAIVAEKKSQTITGSRAHPLTLTLSVSRTDAHSMALYDDCSSCGCYDLSRHFVFQTFCIHFAEGIIKLLLIIKFNIVLYSSYKKQRNHEMPRAGIVMTV